MSPRLVLSGRCCAYRWSEAMASTDCRTIAKPHTTTCAAHPNPRQPNDATSAATVHGAAAAQDYVCGPWAEKWRCNLAEAATHTTKQACPSKLHGALISIRGPVAASTARQSAGRRRPCRCWRPPCSTLPAQRPASRRRQSTSRSQPAGSTLLGCHAPASTTLHMSGTYSAD